MNILHINSYYSIGKFYKNLYNLQTINGKKISVYIPVAKNFISSFNFGEYSLVCKIYNKIDRFIFYLKHNKIVQDAKIRFQNNDFNVIHAHSLFSNGYVAMKLKEYYSIPYVVAVRNTDVNVFFKKMINLRKLGVNILKNADRVVFLSPSYRNQVIETYVPESIRKSIYDKSVIIPNGIDNFWIENKGSPKQIKSRNDIRLIFVGSIDKNKNVEATI